MGFFETSSQREKRLNREIREFQAKERIRKKQKTQEILSRREREARAQEREIARQKRQERIAHYKQRLHSGTSRAKYTGLRFARRFKRNKPHTETHTEDRAYSG